MSTSNLSAIDRHVAAVRRKMIFQSFVRHGVVALLIFGGIAWATVLTLELWGRVLPGGEWYWLAGGAGVSLLVALVIAVVRAPSQHSAAVAIDDRLGLKEKFSTALAIEPDGDPFAELARADAVAAAGKVNLRKKFPLRVPTSTWGLLGWAVLIGATVWLVDPLQFNEEVQAEPIAGVDAQEQDAAAAEAIIEQQMNALAALPPEIAEKEEFRIAKDRLDEASRLMDRDPTKSRETAEEAREKLAEALKNQIEKGEQFAKAKEQAKNFRSLQPPSDEEGSVAEAHRAMANADFEKAIENLEKAVDGFEEMTQEQKEEAAEQMEDLANAMQQMADDPQKQQQMQQQLQQMGMNQQQAQQAQQLMQQAAQGNQQAAQQLQQMAQQAQQQMNNGQGATPQQQQAMQQMMNQMQQQAAGQQQAQQMQQMAQQMAQSMQQQAQQGQQQQQGQQGQQQQQQGGQQGGQQQQQAGGQQQGGQQGQQGGQQGGQQQGAGGMQGAGQQMQNMLSQMQAVQQNAAQMQAAQQAAGGQGGQQGQGQGQQPGQQGQGVGPFAPGQAQQPGQGAGGPGQGNGGRLPYAPAPFGVKQEVSKSFDDEGGQVIASTLIEADALKGESKAAVRDIAAAETSDATDEVDTQRVSRRAQKAVRDYFNSMAGDAGGRGNASQAEQSSGE